MKRGDWEGFWRHWGKLIGVYGVAVYFVLRHNPQASYSDISLALGISYRQVIRAVQTLQAYNLVVLYTGAGGKKTEIGLTDPVGWFVKPVEFIPFPELITCERGHDFGQDDGARQCRHCGLLKAEVYYQEMAPMQ